MDSLFEIHATFHYFHFRAYIKNDANISRMKSEIYLISFHSI